MHAHQLVQYVIKPVLWIMSEGLSFDADSREAQALILGTGMVESRLQLIRQTDGGPAKSIYQIEPYTHDQIWEGYLEREPALAAIVWSLVGGWNYGDGSKPESDELYGNLHYATAMCRCRYLWVPEALPTEPRTLTEYWKQHYNTHKGAGEVNGVTISRFRDALNIVQEVEADQ